jgi:hypothetical protein
MLKHGRFGEEYNPKARRSLSNAKFVAITTMKK